jgi:hypothetical protein
MRPVAVVMLHEDVQDLLKMLVVQDQQPVGLEIPILSLNIGLRQRCVAPEV